MYPGPDGIRVPGSLTKNGEEFVIPPRSWFETARAPEEFLDMAMSCNHALRTDVFFRKRVEGKSIDYLQEAITAGEFGGLVNHHSRCAVALVAEREQFPDFRLIMSSPKKQLEFESVWADESGRAVEDEYRRFYERKNAWQVDRRAAIAAGQSDPGEYSELEHYSPDEEEEKAREAIPRVTAEKASKGYPRSTRLVVRNNLGTLPDFEYRKLTQPWHQQFSEIWILEAPMLVRVYPDVKRFGDPSRWPLP